MSSRARLAGSLPSAKSLPRRVSATPDTSEGVKRPFMMPAEPPTKDEWIPDSAASTCMACQRERFSMVSSIILLVSSIQYIHFLKVVLLHHIFI